MKINSPMVLNLADNRAFRTWLYQMWQSVFVVSPHVHFSSIGNKTIKTGTGILKSFCINIKGSNDSVINFYDNNSPSGDLIFSISGDAKIGEYFLDKSYNNGLTVDITGTDSPDILIVFE